MKTLIIAFAALVTLTAFLGVNYLHRALTYPSVRNVATLAVLTGIIGLTLYVANVIRKKRRS